MKLTKISPKIFSKALPEENSAKESSSETGKNKPLPSSRLRVGTLGVLTLGLLSLIRSASADDGPKLGAPVPQQQTKLKPFDIPKLIEKKQAIPEELFDELLDNQSLALQLLPSLPEEVAIKMAKRGFREQAKALKENSSNLMQKELRVESLFQYTPYKNLKSILKESKNEYQELIEVYINALADKENKRKNTAEESASWNAWVLGNKLLTSRVTEAAPEGLFKESWYAKIDKIVERIDKEFTFNSPHETKKWATNSITALAKLESKENKESKLYKTLLTLVDKGDVSASAIAADLPETVQVELTRIAFNGIKKALVSNSSDLENKENNIRELLNGFSGNKLKILLSKTKNEYQELIEAYLDALGDKENGRKNTPDESTYYNAWALDVKILSPSLQSVPPGLFKESWYPKIEKIASRMDKEFISNSYSTTARTYTVGVITALSNLEFRKDSGIKEPKLYNTLFTFVDKGHASVEVIVKGLPETLQVELTKKVLDSTKKALINNSSDLSSKENSTEQLLNNFSGNDLKTLLLKTKNEYQELIEAYVNALADKENKRKSTTEESASWNGWVLGTKLLTSRITDAAPPGLFKETWYPKTEKILERINNELVDAPRIYTQLALASLIALELKNDSGIKEPKIFHKLIDLADKNPKTYFPSNWNMLHNSIVREAVMNDNPKGSRVPNPTLIVPKESLIQPYESLIKKIITNLPPINKTQEDLELHNSVIQATIFLSKAPISRPKQIIDFQDQRLTTISKANMEEIPGALTQLQSMILSHSLHKENNIVEAGKKHIMPIINIGFQGLLDEDSKKNEAGLKTILLAQNFYGTSPSALIQDESIKKLCNLALDRFQNKELKDDVAIRTYREFVYYIHNERRDPELLKAYTSGLNKQIVFTSKTKEKAINPQELRLVTNRETELLKGANQLIDYFDNNNNPEYLKHVEPLFKATREHILKDAFSVETLNQGRELFTRVAYYPTSNNKDDKENRRFFKETVMPYFSSLLESSTNLSKSEKKDFQEQVYQNIFYFFRAANIEELKNSDGLGNLFILDETLQSMSKNFFNVKDENKIDQFMLLPKSVYLSSERRKGDLWTPYMTVKMLNLQKDYLNSALKETNTLLDSSKATVQVDTLDALSSYKQFLEYIRPQLDTAVVKHVCTKDEQEIVKDLIELHIASVNNILTDKFEKVQVTRKMLSNSFEHEINDDVFRASVKSIENIISGDKTLNKKYLELIDTRLKTETDPRTRGMLYRTIAKLNPDKALILERFKKAIITEDSPITAQYIGEELGEIFFREMKELPEYKALFNTQQNQQPRHNGNQIDWFGRTAEFGEAIELFNKNLEAGIKTGEGKANENMPIQNTLLFLTNNSKGRNLTALVKENLSEELLQKLNSRKDGDEIDPRILKVAFRILSNSNNALSGFLQKVSYDEVREKYITWIDSYDREKKAYNAFDNLNKNITSLLEDNLYQIPVMDTLPHIAGALMSATRNSEDLRARADFLNEKIFKGTEKRLGLFERYETGLQHRFIWEYLENYRNKNGNDATTEENCRAFLKQIDNIRTLQDPGKRKEGRRDIGLEVSRLDPKLYSEKVRIPLERARVKFIEELIAFAGNRQRRDYMEIVLNTFELRNQVPESELNRIRGITD